MDTGSTRPPRLRRKSSAFKLSLSRASQTSAYAQAVHHPPPPTPSLPSSADGSDSLNSTQDFTFVLPSPLTTSTAASSLHSPTVASLPPESPFLTTFESTMFPSSSSASSSASSAINNPLGIGGGGGGGSTISNSFPNVPSASLSSTLELLKQLVQKRLTAWNYLKNVSQGKIYWFNTILLTKEDLRQFFPNDKMRARTSRFTILSMSLSSMLEIHQANDFLRGLLNLVQEFESIPEDKFSSLVTSHSGSGGTNGLGLGGNGASVGGGGSSRSGQKSLFKLNSGKSRSRSGTTTPGGGGGSGAGGMGSGFGTSGISSAGIGNLGSGSNYSSGGGGGGGGADFAFGDGSETGSLFIPNIPFDLDYLEVLTTTCDLLIQMYSKISNYLGMGGMLEHQQPITKTASGGIANTSTGGTAGGGGGGGALSQGLAEIVLKIDTRLKKLISLLSKEIDSLARIAIKNELESLSGGIEGWGFEGPGSMMTIGGE